MMPFPTLSLETEDTRGTSKYDSIFLIGFGLVLLGLIFPFFGSPSPRFLVSFAIIVAGLAFLTWAFRKLPKTKYYVYLIVDPSGVHYRKSPDRTQETIPWEKILSVKACHSMDEGEFRGIEIHTMSANQMIKYLAMGQGIHIDNAAKAIELAINEWASNR
jgi:hypothetical protein